MERQTVIMRQVNGANIEEPVVPPPAPAHKNEGKTIAGWTLMYVVGLGALLVAIGMMSTTTGLIIAGVVVIAVGLIASAVLRALGYGQPRPAREADPGA